MYSAPSVSYPVGRCVWWGTVWVGATLAAVLATGALSWSLDGLVPVAGVATAGAFSLWWVWRSWWHTPRGHLAWAQGRGTQSPGDWYWRADQGDAIEAIAELSVIVVLEDRMCLCVKLAHQPRWTLWLERETLPARWHAMRQAVWASRHGLTTASPGAAPIGPVDR